MRLISAVGALTLAVLAGGSASARDVRYDRGDYRSRQAHRLGLERGYEEGFAYGWKDAARGRFDLRRHRDYRDGDKGYRRSDGNRDDYVRGYRAGFKEGYESAVEDYKYGRGRGRGARRDGRAYPRGRSRDYERDDDYYRRH